MYQFSNVTIYRSAYQAQQIGKLLHWHIATLLHWYIGTLLHFQIVTLKKRLFSYICKKISYDF